MGAPTKITEEVFEQTKKLLSTKLFDRKQIGEMVGISRASVDQINTFHSLTELRAAQKAAWELTQQRKKEKEERERAAANAYSKALAEEAEAVIQKKPNDYDKFDSPELKMEIIIEKLDIIVNLLKEVRIAQTAKPVRTEIARVENFLDDNPGFNEKPF